MPTLDNIEQIMALYWEGDRSEVRKRYEELFGNLDAPSESNPEPTEEEETDEKVEQLAEKAASVPTDIEAAFSDIVSELGFTEPI